MVLQSHIMHKIDKTKRISTVTLGNPTGEKANIHFLPHIRYSVIIQYPSIFSKLKVEKCQFFSSCHLPWRRGMNTTLLAYKQISDAG